jgi:hypothetical protein
MEINYLMSSKSNQSFEIQQTENVQLKRIFKLTSKSLSNMPAHWAIDNIALEISCRQFYKYGF